VFSIVALEVDLLLVDATPEHMSLKLLNKDSLLGEWFTSHDVACGHNVLAR